MKNKKKPEPDKKVFSFFVLAFPTILIVVFGLLVREWWVSFIQTMLAVYQFAMLKQFVDEYYALVN